MELELATVMITRAYDKDKTRQDKTTLFYQGSPVSCKAKISSSLLKVDEGNCLFPRNELIPLTIILNKSVVLIILNLI